MKKKNVKRLEKTITNELLDLSDNDKSKLQDKLSNLGYRGRLDARSGEFDKQLVKGTVNHILSLMEIDENYNKFF